MSQSSERICYDWVLERTGARLWIKLGEYMQWHTHGPRSLECVGKAKGNIENKLISERKQIYEWGMNREEWEA